MPFGRMQHCECWPSTAWLTVLCCCEQGPDCAHLAVARSVLPQSPQANIIIGLDLLRLLVENRIAEFHTELELLSPEVSCHFTLTSINPAEGPQDLLRLYMHCSCSFSPSLCSMSARSFSQSRKVCGLVNMARTGVLL